MSPQGNRLSGKVAIVTGAGSGFGAAISERFAAEGCRVLIGDINEKGAKATADKIGGNNTIIMNMNVTSADNWKAAVDAVVQKWGRLDIVVNNAGTSYKNKPTVDVTEAEFQRVFDVNVKSVFLSIPATIPQLKKQGEGGSIINIASIGSKRPRPGLVWYNSSKGAVSNATMGLASEYGADQIRVNAILPLLSGTGLFETFVGVPHTAENVKQFIGAVPLGRLTDPMDIANAALYLASDEGKFVTGVNLEIDGGKGI